MSDKDLRQPPEDLLMPAVGAALFASEEPIQPKELCQAFGKIDLRQSIRSRRRLNSSMSWYSPSAIPRLLPK